MQEFNITKLDEYDNFKIAMATIETVEANHFYNTNKVLEAINLAGNNHANIIIFGEMVLNGYCVNDLLFSYDFELAEQQAIGKIQSLSKSYPNMAIVLGSYSRDFNDGIKSPHHNVALVIQNGKTIFSTKKTILANNDVFFEKRYFESNTEEPKLWEFNGKKIAILICEDIWHETKKNGNLAKKMVDKGSDLIISINASHYEQGKTARREQIASTIASYGVPFVYVNLLGAREEIVFDGHSMVYLPTRQNLSKFSTFFDECIEYFNPFATICPNPHNLSSLDEVLMVATAYIKSYVNKTGLSKVHLGLSGGVDSALVVALAVRALGKDNVVGILLPSKYSSSHSISDAELLAKNLGIKTHTISIENLHQNLATTTDPSFSLTGLADENSQSRLRGLILMAYSNANNSLLLTTGNKCEIATGYGTLYGDMNGAINPIGDLYKGQVYELCYYINKLNGSDVIPTNILIKEPSAELRDNQKDSDSLPDYDKLDSFLKDYLEEEVGVVQLKQKYGVELTDKIIRLIKINEFKRKQSPPILKLSKKSFGIGRRYPLQQPLGENSW